MAFDEGLAQRVREALHDKRVTEKRRFGGIAFLSRSYMFIGVAADTLMVRVGPDAYEPALKRPHVRVMDFTGRPMKGYVFVDPPGLERDADVARWVKAGLTFVATLPAKSRARA